MSWRHLRRDLRRDAGVNVVLVLVLTLSAFLVATGTIVGERLIGSVDALFEQAEPPHFLQMHRGDYDVEALEAFAASRPEIEDWLVEDMLGYDGAAISWSRPGTGASGDLSESLIDNLVVTQNDAFDLLVGPGGQVPRPGEGEIWVPVAYQQQFDLQEGDRLALRTGSGTHDLEIAGFVRDAQMASSLSSATRFVVAPVDFETLRAAGGAEPEIIVEYRLQDATTAGALQTAYQADDTLPQNGQAVTYRMIRLINIVSDGLVVAALLATSVLLVLIAFLSIRFVVRGMLQDEVHEIGVMKAIGLPDRFIAGLFLARFRALTLIACVLGGLLAVGAASVLTRTLTASYGAAPIGVVSVLAPLLSLVLVYAVVIGLCRAVLRSVRRVEVVSALVHGSTSDERGTARRARREAARARGTDLAGPGAPLAARLVLQDLRADRGQWALVPLVFALVAMLMWLPTTLLSTVESPRFVTYLGAPESDLRADVLFGDDLEATHDQLLAAWESDARVDAVRDFGEEVLSTPGEEGWEALRVDVGDHRPDDVAFVAGTAPEQGQIALSVLNAEQHGVGPGDWLTVRGSDARERRLRVSGVYQDVTSGGYTAKMQGRATEPVGYTIFADTVAGADPAAVVADYDGRYASASIVPMRDYVDQTLSSLTGVLRSATVLCAGLGIGVTLLITSLFLRLRMVRGHERLGTLSALGFSGRELAAQIRAATVVVAALGVLTGLLASVTVGEGGVGVFLGSAGLGIAGLDLAPDPWVTYLALPLGLVALGYAAAATVTTRLQGASPSHWLRR